MKTAEDWIKWPWNNWNCDSKTIANRVRVIQLDAIRHGMTLAAEACLRLKHAANNPNTRHGCECCAEAILSDRDNLTALP